MKRNQFEALRADLGTLTAGFEILTARQDRFEVLIEDVQGDIKTILEVLIPMKEKVDRIPKIEQDIDDIKADIRTIKFSLKQTNVKVDDHETRIAQLETA